MILSLANFIHLSLSDILDILLVAVIIFLVLRWIKGSTAMNIFIAIMILVVMNVIVEALDLKMVSSLLGTLLDAGAVVLIIIFQPEIRRFLSDIGRSAGSAVEKRQLLEKIFSHSDSSLEGDIISAIATACKNMSGQMTGALIVIRRNNLLESTIATGDTVDAAVVSRLLENIFFKNSPLHDGAVVIGGNRIIAARCTLPITERTDLPAHYGMRHKAAVGISEQSDADVVVVSEQTGRISFVRGGMITPIEDINTLKNLLMDEKKA